MGYYISAESSPPLSSRMLKLWFSFQMVAMVMMLLMSGEAHGFATSKFPSRSHPNTKISWSDYGHHRWTHLTLSSSSSTTNTLQEQDDDASSSLILSAKAKELQEKADKLRAEIAALQDSKEQVQEAERQELQAELDQQEAYMKHYSGIVPILKPDGSVVMEQVQFPPLMEKKEEEDGYCSDILVCEASLPLGMILGQDTEQGSSTNNNNAMIVVDEILPDSNGALAGIKEGDILRACTSCRVEMEQPTWQLLVGGIGRPKTMRFMFGTDDQPLEIVLEALGANRMDPEARPVVLVVERPKNRK